LPAFADYGYLNEMKERVEHSGLVTRSNTVNENALVSLVQEATGKTSKDWHIRRAAKTANLPQHDFSEMHDCGEMFLQQTVYSPISELFSCFNVSMYCADKEVECAHVVGCKANILAGKRYRVSCMPDATLRLTEDFYVGAMMEINPFGADDELLKFDKYKCILMTCMSVLAIKEYLLEDCKQKMKANTPDFDELACKQPVYKKIKMSVAKKAKSMKSSKDETKVDYEEFAIPFVLAEYNSASLYVTRVLKQSGCPVVLKLLRIPFTNSNHDEKQRKSEFMAMLAILVADIFTFSKRHYYGLNDFFSCIRTSQTSLPPENALSRTKSSEKKESETGSTRRKEKGFQGHSQVPAKPSKCEDAALQIASRFGLVKKLDYAFPRTQTLCLDYDSSGQRCQWEADMKYFQQESPYYFKGFYITTSVFCKVWREGDSRTNRQNIKDEICFLQKAHEGGVPSPRLIKELTAMDITHSTFTENESNCPTLYHVLVTEYYMDYAVAEQDISNYAVQLVKAVLSLHKIRILHCDIKPKNILWDAKEKVLRLIDFGHAQEIINAQSYHATQKYEAPEISENYPHSKMTEAYSVGKTLEEKCKNFKSLDAEKIQKLAASLQSDLPLRWSLEDAETFLNTMDNGKSNSTLHCNLENIENGQSLVKSSINLR
jgi:tRNA A-37 threonylcarbamoyl transferase component Bud32